MVVGMLPENERGLRESMENHFGDDLQKRGYNAVSSLRELGPSHYKIWKNRKYWIK